MLFFKDYQEKAILRLRHEVNELLDSANDEVLVFKSPTGSGKTLMTAEFIRRLVDSRNDNKQIAFIWIAVNKLHDQSRNSLKKYYDSEAVAIKCSLYDELRERQIQQNEILFLNWASINNENKLLIKDNERDNTLERVVSRTKEAGRTVILIVDESHHTASSANSTDIIARIGPKVTIEVSATPQIKSDYIVPVKIEDVRAEGMIKKEIIVNDGFANYSISDREPDMTADELVLKGALDKRKDLLQSYKDNSVQPINPLVLIQLPDSKAGTPDKKEDVLRMLAKFGYKENDPRVAIYLTGKEKINLENIEKPDNEVEVMLFKQAIALGWDCPRASILVLFRQWTDTNLTFSIQTLGRIMRMPEQIHYKADNLNSAYLYTSLPDIETRIENDIQPNFKLFKSVRSDTYDALALKSYHSKRFREETRLSSDFVNIFFKAAEELNLKTNFSFSYTVPVTSLIGGGVIENSDNEVTRLKTQGTLDLIKNEVEIQVAFDEFVRDNLEPFYPEARSIKRINESIYAYFDALRDEDRWPQIQASVLANENKQFVIDVLSRSKEIYVKKIGKGKNQLIENESEWEIPVSVAYPNNYVRKDYTKSVMQPYYSKSTDKGEEDSAVEVEFINFLDNNSSVAWWFKNGSADATYFAVPYEEHQEQKAFYVDFIVMLKSGKLGLFDTKGGITAETAGSRAEGLMQYIKKANTEGKNIYGGIVVKDKNSWKLNVNIPYVFNENDLSNWAFLELE